MAHFAQINGQNVVIDVLVVSNDNLNYLPFPESEPVGVAFLTNLLPNTMWKQTSYTGNFRFRYAGIGYTFHPESGEYGGFAPPPEYPDFIFDVDTCSWIPPVPYPNDGNAYEWDDAKHEWVKIPDVTVIGE